MASETSSRNNADSPTGKESGTQTKPARKRGRPPLAENRRADILAAAARFFATRGYENTSLRQIAEEMGVSKATVYHYFATKQEIIDAIIVETLRELVEVVGARVAEPTGSRDKMIAFMVGHADYFQSHYWAFSTMLVGFEGMWSVEMRHEALHWRDKYEELLRSIISDGIKTGELREVDVKLTGRAVLSVLNWMARWYRPDKERDARDFVKEYFDILFHGLSAS